MVIDELQFTQSWLCRDAREYVNLLYLELFRFPFITGSVFNACLSFNIACSLFLYFVICIRTSVKFGIKYTMFVYSMILSWILRVTVGSVSVCREVRRV